MPDPNSPIFRMDDLPQLCLQLVLSYLTPGEQFLASLVCSRWARVLPLARQHLVFARPRVRRVLAHSVRMTAQHLLRVLLQTVNVVLLRALFSTHVHLRSLDLRGLSCISNREFANWADNRYLRDLQQLTLPRRIDARVLNALG